MPMLIRDGVPTSSGAATEARLARHFLARLVHAERGRAVERALVEGLLMEAEPDEQARSARKGRSADKKERWPSIADFGLDANNEPDDVGALPCGSHLCLGPRLKGLSRTELVRVLAHSDIRLDEAALAIDEEAATARQRNRAAKLERNLVTPILRAVRDSAPPPGAADVATLHLLGSAIGRSGSCLKASLAPLRQRCPIVSLVCPVEGFEGNLLSLLRKGTVLPGRAATSDGYGLRWRNDVSFRETEGARREIIVFRGKRLEDMETETVRRQVGIAAQCGYPILGIAEAEDALPESLRLAASLSLRPGPLTIGIVGATMDAVLGESPVEMDRLEDDCHLLSLADLSVAIRPGVSADRALEVLVKLAEARRRSGATEKAKGDGRDGRGSGGTSGWSGSSSSSRRGGDQGTGSEIIRPATLTGVGADDPTVPLVETSSGYGAATEWALSLQQDLELWRAGDLGWDEMSPKLLLSGPPGTGKTRFARALCNTLQVPLIATSVSTWLEPGYLGDVIKRMRRAFDEAVSHAPAILFIDEIDGIARRTSSGRPHEDYWNSMVNKLLELLDGTTRSDGVIVVGAANNPGAIDPALRRSGRLERHIVIPRPDTDALVGILRHHLREDLETVIATRPGSPARSSTGTVFRDKSAHQQRGAGTRGAA